MLYKNVANFQGPRHSAGLNASLYKYYGIQQAIEIQKVCPISSVFCLLFSVICTLTPEAKSSWKAEILADGIEFNLQCLPRYTPS